MGLLKPGVTIPLTDIQQITIYRIKHNLITTRATLNVYYTEDGTKKKTAIAQAFNKKGIQNIYNEIEQIINSSRY